MKIERKKVLTSPQVGIDRGLPWALALALAGAMAGALAMALGLALGVGGGLWGGGEGGGRIKNLSTNPHRRTTKWVTETLIKAWKWV